LLHLCLAVCKDHHQHMCVYHPEMLAVTKHSTDLSLHILLPNDTSNLARKYRCVDHIFKNEIEIELYKLERLIIPICVMQTHHFHCERKEKCSL
jgi:hypothetical protein